MFNDMRLSLKIGLVAIGWLLVGFVLLKIFGKVDTDLVREVLSNGDYSDSIPQVIGFILLLGGTLVGIVFLAYQAFCIFLLGEGYDMLILLIAIILIFVGGSFLYLTTDINFFYLIFKDAKIDLT